MPSMVTCACVCFANVAPGLLKHWGAYIQKHRSHDWIITILFCSFLCLLAVEALGPKLLPFVEHSSRKHYVNGISKDHPLLQTPQIAQINTKAIHWLSGASFNVGRSY